MAIIYDKEQEGHVVYDPEPDPWKAIVSGYQGSATGLLVRGRLPDVVLDHEHAKWYEKALESASGTISDIPEMTLGSAIGRPVGAMLGTAVAPGPGTAVGAAIGSGAGAFAVPAAIRESLVQAYQNGEVTSSADFLNRASIVLKKTGQAGLIGGLTTLTGGAAAIVAKGLGANALIQTTARLAGEGTAMTVAPAALEGRLPEPQDFVNAAITIAGLKSAHLVAGKLADIYRKTGVTPEQIATDAATDPELKKDIQREWTGAPTKEELLSELPPLEWTPTGTPEGLARLKAHAEEVHRRNGITTDSVPQAYKPLEEAEFLRNALPEPAKVQDVINNPSGTIPVDKTPNHINYDFAWETGDVLSLRAKIADTFKQEIEAARGKESWNQTQEKAQDVIKNRLASLGEEQKAAALKMPFSDLAANAMAVQAMADKAAFDARQAATRIIALGDQATPEDIARQVKAIETAAWLHAIDQGNGAEIARAQNARKAFAQRQQLVEGWGKMLAQYGADHRALARMVAGLDTTEAMTAFASRATQASTWEKFVEAWKAGILSGPITHQANLIGNTTFMAVRPIVDLVAAAMGKAMSREERVSFAEPFARIIGNLQGMKDALVFAGETLHTAYREGGLDEVFKKIAIPTDTGKSEQFRQAIGGVKGHIIRLPFRALELADDLFRIGNERGELHALAARQAAKEGFDIASREFRERMVDLVQNPTAKMTEASETAGKRFTFNQPLGEAGRAVQNLVNKAHLQLLVPFVRTPANIFKEMTRMTPLAPLVKDWRADVAKGGADAAKAYAEIALGTTLGAMAASYVADGNLTGQGNPDPDKRLADELAGKQSYSVKVGNRWYSYQRIQPLGTLVGMAADMAEVMQHMTDDEHNKAATMVATAFANAVTQQTFLQGFTSIIQVMADPARYGPRFIEQYAGSLVPALIAQPTQTFDPVQREVHNLREAVEARIPGRREKLEARINPLTGEPLQTRERLGVMSPINVTDISDDKVLLEAARLGVGVKKAPKSIETPSAGIRGFGKIELTPEQQTIFSTTAGHMAYQALSSVVASPTWDTMPDIIKKRVFERALQQTRRLGAMTAITPEQRLDKAQEIVDKISAQLNP